jgi:hypothetical protein
MLTCLVSSTVTVLGSEQAFHEYLKHHQNDNQAVVLPRLYEPVPKHVPAMSDQALVRLWETNQFSPILRSTSLEIQLAEAVTAERNLNPVKFDAEHPLLGRILGDVRFYEYAMYLYNLDTRRFVHYHHQLIPILRGMTMMPKPGGSGPEQIETPPSSPEISPPPGGTSSGGPVPPEALTIPEPPGLVLLALGLAYVVFRVWGRRIPALP